MSEARYRVTAPNREYNGKTGKCQFSDGVYEGPVEDGTLLYFEQAAYAVQVLEGKPALAEHGVSGSALDSPPPDELKGKALDAALTAAGLPLGGTAADKRARLTEFQASREADLGAGGGDAPGGDVPAAELKGAALDDALDAAGLSKAGTADDKRARLEAFQAGAAAAGDHDQQNGA